MTLPEVKPQIYSTNRTKSAISGEKRTNADRIRAMTDEELADEILSWFNWLNAVEWDDNRILEWLKQESGDSLSCGICDDFKQKESECE